jgi:hypothetical protein
MVRIIGVQSNVDLLSALILCLPSLMRLLRRAKRRISIYIRDRGIKKAVLGHKRPEAASEAGLLYIINHLDLESSELQATIIFLKIRRKATTST